MQKEVIPTSIQLDASSICQLRCVSCPNTSGASVAIGRGFLKFKNVEDLLDKNPHIELIELANYGEMFLNPDLLKILKIAFERKIILTATSGVNLNNVKEVVLEGLVKYQFKEIVCSIDGATNETYKQYRVGGDFNNVIENLKKINFYKEKYNAKYPFLKWQFVIFGHNEHEIPAVRKMAKDLNMTFDMKLSWDNNFSPIKDMEMVRRELGASTRKEYQEKFGVNYSQLICHQLWDLPTINWDGKILGCCRNFWGDFGGNAFNDGLINSLNNERINYARNMLTGKSVARDDIPCTTCDIYIDLAKNKKWIKRVGLFSPNNPIGIKIKAILPEKIKRVIKPIINKKYFKG